MTTRGIGGIPPAGWLTRHYTLDTVSKLGVLRRIVSQRGLHPYMKVPLSIHITVRLMGLRADPCHGGLEVGVVC